MIRYRITLLLSFNFGLPFPRRDRGVDLHSTISVTGNWDAGLRLAMG